MSNHPNRSRSGSPARNPSPDEIRAAREAAGLTQEAAAELVLAARRAWQNWELGQRQMHPGLWKLFRIEVERLGFTTAADSPAPRPPRP